MVKTALKSIFNFYIFDYLKSLNNLPLKNQLIEIRDFKVLILDYCGQSAKCFALFENFDVFVMEDTREDVSNLVNQYDIVYILIYQSQPVYSINLDLPVIQIITAKNKIIGTEIMQQSNGQSSDD